MRGPSIVACLIFAASLSSAADVGPSVPQHGYATSTLHEPIFDGARVTVETVALDNWLNENYRNLDSSQMTGSREHLYYLVDSYIKQLFESTGQVLPKEHDQVLETLFSWAEPLGVYGGNLIYNRLKAPDVTAREPLIALPKGMSLELTGDLLHVNSSLGWDAFFPYYFMILRLADFTTPDGVRLQGMVVSTGAARDRGSLGHSQATIMLFYAPAADPASFRSYVEERVGIVGTDEHVALGIDGLESQRNVYAGGLLHRELVFLKPDHGSLAIAYLGNEGTYQWNRQHFLDFIRAVKYGPASRDN
jgi:hypothetical protein